MCKNARVQRTGVLMLTLPCHPLGTSLQGSLRICMEEPVQVPTAKGRPRGNRGCWHKPHRAGGAPLYSGRYHWGGRFGKLHCVCDNSEGVCTAAGPAELGGLNSPDPLETQWTRAVRLRPSVSGAEMHPSLATWSHPAARPWLERLRVGGGWGGERNCSQVHAVP